MCYCNVDPAADSHQVLRLNAALQTTDTISRSVGIIRPADEHFDDVAFKIIEEAVDQAGDVGGAVSLRTDLNAIGFNFGNHRIKVIDLETQVLESDSLFTATRIRTNAVDREEFQAGFAAAEHVKLIRFTGLEHLDALVAKDVFVKLLLFLDIVTVKTDVVDKGHVVTHFMFDW